MQHNEYKDNVLRADQDRRKTSIEPLARIEPKNNRPQTSSRERIQKIIFGGGVQMKNLIHNKSCVVYILISRKSFRQSSSSSVQ